MKCLCLQICRRCLSQVENSVHLWTVISTIVTLTQSSVVRTVIFIVIPPYSRSGMRCPTIDNQASTNKNLLQHKAKHYGDCCELLDHDVVEWWCWVGHGLGD